jgi:hypothetical protein
MPDHGPTPDLTASIEQRVAAVQAAMEERGMKAGQFIKEHERVVEEDWTPQNGARVVAKA